MEVVDFPRAAVYFDREFSQADESAFELFFACGDNVRDEVAAEDSASDFFLGVRHEGSEFCSIVFARCDSVDFACSGF